MNASTQYALRDVLVTGGTGFIGQHLVRRLLDAGARVVVLSRGGARVAGVEHVRGDVRDAHAVAALIERRFDRVFHLAGVSGQDDGDMEQSLTTNCLGVLNVLEAIRRHAPATTLCFPSSRLVYGTSNYLPVDEEHAQHPLSLYGMHKRDGEEYCAHYAARWDVRSVTLRLSNPYGPHNLAGHNRYNVANWMIDELCRGRAVTIFGRGEQLRDYLYVDDAVDAMLVAAADETALGNIYNVGSGVGTALIDFVRAGVIAAGGGSYRLQSWPQNLLRVETGDYVANIEGAGSGFGWSPRVSLMEGLTRTVAVQRRLIARSRAVEGRPGDDFDHEQLEAAA